MYMTVIDEHGHPRDEWVEDDLATQTIASTARHETRVELNAYPKTLIAQVVEFKPRPYAEVDTECYPDYWLCKFYVGDDMYSFALHADRPEPLNYAAIHYFIENFTLVTFNGVNYDIPMITYALAGATCRQLRDANNAIIIGGLKSWQFYRSYGLEPPAMLDHIDTMEPAPGVRIGLKAYAGRNHAPIIEDLPYNSDEPTTPEMREHLDTYCGHDLVDTRGLREVLKDRIELRIRLSEKYGVDMRSKSDAQMAEAAIKSVLGFKPDKRIVPHGYTFQYEPPPYIRFSTPQLQQVFATVCAAVFVCNDVDQLRTHEGEEVVDADGKKVKTGVLIPPELKKLTIPIGKSSYKFGIGGLHSQESGVNFHTIVGKHTLRGDDVRSYYPSLIILLGMSPQQLGPRFLEVYKEAYFTRLDAKEKAALEKLTEAFKSGDTSSQVYWATIADGLKILLNGTFGKLFSKHSIMFAPELGIRVTITGQLCLLMLIESLEQCGISVLSANTDGIVTQCPAGREWLRDACIKNWEKTTGLGMDAEYIKSLYCQSVNSYLAVSPDGSHKGKGQFAKSGVLNNVHPEKDICAEAVIEYLKKGTRLDATIRQCTDIRKFLVIKNVKGGGVYYPDRLAFGEKVFNEQGAVYLGKTVRWYYGAGNTKAIHYKPKTASQIADADGVISAAALKKKEGNLLGNKVALSDGARPCMTLPKQFPDDIDYPRYVADAIKLLATVGVEYAE